MCEKLIVKTLSEKDWKLVIDAMSESAVSRTSEAQEYKADMPKESYERNMNESDRLVYLINVLEGRKEYSSMTDLEKLELINSMEFIDDDADGENCSSVIVEYNKLNKDILHRIGVSNEYIQREDLVNDKGYINIAPIAFKYSNWWTGEYFENRDEPLVCDTCGIEMEKEEYNSNNGFCDECIADRIE